MGQSMPCACCGHIKAAHIKPTKKRGWNWPCGQCGCASYKSPEWYEVKV